MAESNGKLKIKNSLDYKKQKPSDYFNLLATGLDCIVALKLDEFFHSGRLTYDDLDDFIFEQLNELPAEDALIILDIFFESEFEQVFNKSAYFYGMLQAYKLLIVRNRTKDHGSGEQTNRPARENTRDICNRTGYTLNVTATERRYGGPPPNWDGPAPIPGTEVFCGRIPHDLLEDELIPLFERYGTIWSLRLIMDRNTNNNKGYAFIIYTHHVEAFEAAANLNNFPIRPGYFLRVKLNSINQRIFVGNIPKRKSKEDILADVRPYTAGLSDVIIYRPLCDQKKNRGFAFLDYDSHKTAALAKRWLENEGMRIWDCDLFVDWADPQEEPNSETLTKTKVLFVKNLSQYCSTEELKEIFEVYGQVKSVRIIRDYAFIDFSERDHAIRAMEALNHKELHGYKIEVSLARPAINQRKKEKMLKTREYRMMKNDNKKYDNRLATQPQPEVPQPSTAIITPVSWPVDPFQYYTYP